MTNRWMLPFAQPRKKHGLIKLLRFTAPLQSPTVIPEPTETPSENPGEDSSNKPASVEAPVTKEDGSVFKMFVISEATMINKGDKLVLTLKQTTYHLINCILERTMTLQKHRLSRECRKQTAVIPLHLK